MRKDIVSMMINVSRFIAVQKDVRDRISLYLKNVKDAIKTNYAMQENISSKNEHMCFIREIFESNFSDGQFIWSQIKSELYDATKSIRLFSINSKSDEALNYKEYEKDGLTAIAVGGLSLSRGLTIEGLCVSYMYRNTRMYDTLMQMGRWFGHRCGYEDLCRVFLSKDSIYWYSYISESANNLRDQIKDMRQQKLSPKNFGLYVHSHPDSLLITAPNKMRSGEKRKIKQNFSGQLIESYILPTDGKINLHNRNLIEEFMNSGFGKGKNSLTKKERAFCIYDVSSEKIEEFLISFRTHPDFSWKKNAAIDYLRKISEKYPVADVLIISIGGNKQEKTFRLGAQTRRADLKGESKDHWKLKKFRVASRGDEGIGLTNMQRDEETKLSHGKNLPDHYFRNIRNKPLLMVHMINLELNNKQGRPIKQENTPAFGISFPPGDYSEGVEVVVNWVFIDQEMSNDIYDDPVAEENYDD